jgi:hypothetical protein
MQNVAALERSDNVADRCHAFAGLKRGYFPIVAAAIIPMSRYFQM